MEEFCKMLSDNLRGLLYKCLKATRPPSDQSTCILIRMKTCKNVQVAESLPL